MKKLLVAGLGAVLIGIFNTNKVNATIYTHVLNYNPSDHGNTLVGTVTFDDDFLIPSNYPNGVYSFGAGSFITNITFTHTDNTTEVVSTINSDNFNDTDFARVRIEYTGTPDFSVADLTTELTDIAFRSDSDGSFFMGTNFLRNTQEVNNIGGTIDDDFELNTITYHSPGPLPIFGLLSAFSSMKTLKRKYKNHKKLIIN